MKLAVIGAGLSGLTTLKNSLDEGITVDAFEQTGKLAGVWNYTDATDVDEDGLPLHTVMYKDLITNLPKETMALPGFPHPNVPPSYITQERVLKYFNDYAEHFDLIPHIKFYRRVIKVEPLRESEWKITVEDVKTRELQVLEYDAVAICNGHYHKTVIPKIDGIETFGGKQLHSALYRKPDDYNGRKVLVIGAGPSGIDIANRLTNVAEKIVLSCKATPVLKVSDKIIQKFLVKSISGDTVTFVDDSNEVIDTIIYCTGYAYDFPFLSDSCGITVKNRWVKYLYKHVINVKYPTMGLIGITFECCVVPVNELQSRFFVSSLKKFFQLPSEGEMMEEVNERLKYIKSKGWSERDMHRIANDQQHYCEDLAKVGKINRIPTVVHKIRMRAKEDRRNLKFFYKVIDDENFVAIYI